MFFAPEILEKITFFSTIVFRDMSNHLRLKWLKDGVLINSRWFLATLDIGITYILHSVKFENIKEHKYDCCEYIQTPRFLWNAQFCHFLTKSNHKIEYLKRKPWNYFRKRYSFGEVMIFFTLWPQIYINSLDPGLFNTWTCFLFLFKTSQLTSSLQRHYYSLLVVIMRYSTVWHQV